jgi:hypothetical protein
MNNSKTPQFRSIISKCWNGMLLLLLFMMITDIVECGMRNDFTFLIQDPGKNGLWFIVVMTITNVCMQVSIQTFESKIFRWFVFGATLLYTLLFVLHRVIHLISGEGFDYHFYLDATHHLMGAWAAIFAFKWAKSF